MDVTEPKAPTPSRRRFRYTPLSWVGMAAGTVGWWLGKVIAEAVGWSQFSLPGAALQIAGFLCVALAGFLAINYFFGVCPKATSDVDGQGNK